MNLSKEKFDIIIQGGQSNAEGCGKGPVEKELVPSSNCFYLQAVKKVVVGEDNLHITFPEEPFKVSIAQELVENGETLGDFSLTFAEAYENEILQNGRKLLIVRTAVGGSGFKKGQWGLNNILYLKLLELVDYALSLNPENKVVAFLWHQGEHDAFEGNKPEIYHGQLTDMVSDVRSRYGDMPFIGGDFVSEWKSKNIESCAPIIDVIRRVICEIGNAAFVETSDLPSNNQKIGNGDDIHFCRQSLHELGRRYFEAYCKLKGNK